MKSILMKTMMLAVAVCAAAMTKAADIEFLRELVAIPSATADIPQVNRAMYAMKD